jgi:hypothetical protein
MTYGTGPYGHRAYGEHDRPASPTDVPAAPENDKAAAPLPEEGAATPATTEGDA